MHQIRFVSRKVVAAHIPVPGAILISIHDRSEPPITPLDGWAEVLTLRFHDTDGSQMGLEVFSDDQAREVLQFVDAHRECPEVVVHCQQGHSRSAAIALYLAEKYRSPCFQDQILATKTTWLFYNRLVYFRMLDVDRRFFSFPRQVSR